MFCPQCLQWDTSRRWMRCTCDARPCEMDSDAWRFHGDLAMPIIREEARDIPVVEQCDICVVGGSCTGVFAAVAAARLGAKVAIIEQNGFFGGVATASLVNIWHSLYNTDRRPPDHRRPDQRGGRSPRSPQCRRVVADKPSPSQYITLHTEELKIELDESDRPRRRSGPSCTRSSRRRSCRTAGSSAAIIEDKSGRRAIQASYFIDATGDGDVVHRAGLRVLPAPGDPAADDVRDPPRPQGHQAEAPGLRDQQGGLRHRRTPTP